MNCEVNLIIEFASEHKRHVTIIRQSRLLFIIEDCWKLFEIATLNLNFKSRIHNLSSRVLVL